MNSNINYSKVLNKFSLRFSNPEVEEKYTMFKI